MIIAAASTTEKVELAQSQGAKGGIVYGAGPFDKGEAKALSTRFKEATKPQGANVIYDAVGGDYAEAALRAIAWEGRFLVIGFPGWHPSHPPQSGFAQRVPDRRCILGRLLRP